MGGLSPKPLENYPRGVNEHDIQAPLRVLERGWGEVVTILVEAEELAQLEYFPHTPVSP